MAEGSDEEKTEEPTDHKLEEARKKGDVATSPEVRHAVMFAAALLASGGIGSSLMSGLAGLAARIWESSGTLRVGEDGAHAIIGTMMGGLLLVLLPVLALLAVGPVLIWLLQGSPSFATARLKPKWDKLMPWKGFAQLFGQKALVEFAKTLIKATAVILIAWLVIWPRMTGLDQLIGSDPSLIGRFAGGLVASLLLVMTAAVVALALFDFVYQRQAYSKKMRMSLKEIRDEMKSLDGDPLIKARIRAIRTARARQRMMSAVPAAAVVITNPTHYAVALRYEHGTMAAPVVVAKGVDAIALRIRAVAAEHEVPIVEAPPLARALHAAVRLDQPIPVEHYAAVAEIIGHVMRLKASLPPRG